MRDTTEQKRAAYTEIEREARGDRETRAAAAPPPAAVSSPATCTRLPIAAVLRRDPHRRWSHTEGIPPKSEPPAGVLVRRAVLERCGDQARAMAPVWRFQR